MRGLPQEADGVTEAGRCVVSNSALPESSNTREGIFFVMADPQPLGEGGGAAIPSLDPETVLSSPFAAGLLLHLKAECEDQKARADRAEAQIAALITERDELKAEVVGEPETVKGLTGYVRQADHEALIAALIAERDQLRADVQFMQLDGDVLEERARADAAEARADAADAALRSLQHALEQLVTRLDVVHADPRYMGVWSLFQIHGGRYTEPTYTAELDAARQALLSVPEATLRTLHQPGKDRLPSTD
jgi:hypothetical protein